MPVVLIDVRETASVESSHITGAVSIPGDQLDSFKDRFPAVKSAPIVLYGADTSDGRAYFSTVRGLGYINVTILKGGLTPWTIAGFPVESGKAETKIVYVPKPKPGSVGVDQFSKAADGKESDVVVLDVRTEDETGEGKLDSSIAIPAEVVVERLSEIP